MLLVSAELGIDIYCRKRACSWIATILPFWSFYSSQLTHFIRRHLLSGKFIKTFTNTSSVESSLEAAADEMVDNEDKLAGRYKGE